MSDASYCDRTKSNGYGVWVKSDRGHFQCGGNIKGGVDNPQEAEAKAMANALWFAFYQGIAKEGDRLIIQTDCVNNIHAFKNGIKNKNHSALEPLEFCKSLLKEKKCLYELRHVKAHDPSLGNRNYVNDICDKLAGQAMRKQRGF